MKKYALTHKISSADSVRSAVGRRGPNQMGMGMGPQLPQGPHGQMGMQQQMMGQQDPNQYDPNQMHPQQQQQGMQQSGQQQQQQGQQGQPVSVVSAILFKLSKNQIVLKPNKTTQHFNQVPFKSYIYYLFLCSTFTTLTNFRKKK